MRTDTQISRGMERLMCRAAGARLEGLFGLSGFGAVDNFHEMRGILAETGMVDVENFTRGLERQHRCACASLKAALPVAVEVMHGMMGLKKDIKKALKSTDAAKIAKVMAKEQAKIDKAPTSKKAAKRVEYVRQLQEQLSRATTPEEAGAAVLTTASPVPLVTPEAQEFAQQLVASAAAPGSTAPAASMFDAPPADAAPAESGLFGIPPWGLALGVAGLGFLLIRRRGR
jgi:hypothetical protein